MRLSLSIKKRKQLTGGGGWGKLAVFHLPRQVGQLLPDFRVVVKPVSQAFFDQRPHPGQGLTAAVRFALAAGGHDIPVLQDNRPDLPDAAPLLGAAHEYRRRPVG